MQESIEALLFGNRRNIMGIIPDVTISEKHVDELIITDQPVEYGSNFSDHAYLKPPEVSIKFGWSESSQLLNSILSGSIFSGISSLNGQYEALLALQAARIPMQIVTGRRIHDDMLIASLSVLTDEKTENALMVEASFRKVLIVYTEMVQLKPEDQKSAETFPVEDAGQKQPVENKSILAGGSGMIGKAMGF